MRSCERSTTCRWTDDQRPADPEEHPDPIARARTGRGLAGRPGKLRTYPGLSRMGKTYAMLRDARARRLAGADTVVAQWERHGRPGTAAQLEDLELVPLRTVTHRGASFAELDLNGGSRPGVRSWPWWTSSPTRTSPASATRNAGRTSTRCRQAASTPIRPSTSPTSIAGPGRTRITGVRPAEPVPDAFVRSGEVKLVDLAPSALRHRLAEGLVVPGDQVDTALSNYFRFANLAALRELAQLWLDDSRARRRHGVRRCPRDQRNRCKA